MKLSSLIPMLFLVAVPMGACGAAGGADPPAAVPAGSWGGNHVSMQVTGSGATLQFDCAHGRIPSLLSLDAQGRFEIAGVFVREHGGPIQQGEPEDSHPAVYSGRLEGNDLTLSIRLSDDGTETGPFTVRLGTEARLFRCY
jgi:hypothetical protein